GFACVVVGFVTVVRLSDPYSVSKNSFGSIKIWLMWLVVLLHWIHSCFGFTRAATLRLYYPLHSFVTGLRLVGKKWL
ncbi:hypothetical protein A2U01_0016666, partial [Trifolium medium]|nr:hypothetical protein [Trifolium medium]